MTEQLLTVVESTAQLSDCGRYRYTLTRRFAPGPTVVFIGLNPSTADATQDDPTIRRCLGFARRWGYGRLVMLNLYALRATDPRGLWGDVEPRGEMINGPTGFDRNIYAVGEAIVDARRIVCAWGADPGPDPDRPALIMDVLSLASAWAPTVALALTKHGQPRHPLYVRGDVEPVPYPPGGAA